MSKKGSTTFAFNGTAEQSEKLVKVFKEYEGQQGSLMPVMQAAQEIYGYLPFEVQLMIAENLDIPLEEVYGVATFYAQFSLNPKGKYKIGVCMGTACYVKGAADVLERTKAKLGIDVGECTEDGKFSIEDTRCLGCCGLAPVMMINDAVFARLKPDDIDDILASYNDK